MEKNKVLIVGAGPAGLTLACSLARQGIQASIVDKRSSSTNLPRAINVSSPVLSIFEKLGICSSILKQGLRLDELKVYWKKNPLININYKYFKANYPYFLHLEQSKIETYLERRLSTFGVEVQRLTTIDDIQQQQDGVEVKLTNNQIEAYRKKFAYVIGCDGGNSTVRGLLGINYKRNDYASHFVLIDGDIDHQYKDGLNNLHYYLTENGYLIVAPLPDNKCRLIASFKGRLHESKSIYQSDDYFQDILDIRGPGHIRLKNVLWSTSGNFYHKIAKTGQKGRVFIAGDALHQFSPVGGANMNVGIQDAYSLGQKLANVICGRMDESSLDSYSDERLKVAEKYVVATSEVTNLLTRTSEINWDQESKFLPLMRNREFIKHTLPEMFSGEYFIN